MSVQLTPEASTWQVVCCHIVATSQAFALLSKSPFWWNEKAKETTQLQPMKEQHPASLSCLAGSRSLSRSCSNSFISDAVLLVPIQARTFRVQNVWRSCYEYIRRDGVAAREETTRSLTMATTRLQRPHEYPVLPGRRHQSFHDVVPKLWKLPSCIDVHLQFGGPGRWEITQKAYESFSS